MTSLWMKLPERFVKTLVLEMVQHLPGLQAVDLNGFFFFGGGGGKGNISEPSYDNDEPPIDHITAYTKYLR